MNMDELANLSTRDLENLVADRHTMISHIERMGTKVYNGRFHSDQIAQNYAGYSSATLYDITGHALHNVLTCIRVDEATKKE